MKSVALSSGGNSAWDRSCDRPDENAEQSDAY